MDPLSHPTETGTDEDKETVYLSNLNFDGAPAGYFYSFHAYPYYSDYISENPSYKQYYDPLGQNSYCVYNSNLKIITKISSFLLPKLELLQLGELLIMHPEK